MKIIPASFKPATATVAEVGEFYAKIINGTVEIESEEGNFTVWAIDDNSTLSALGFMGRYNTGAKDWRVSFSHMKARGFDYVRFGRDDRAPKFHKQSGVRFDPVAFFKV